MSADKLVEINFNAEHIEEILKNDASLPDVMISLKGYQIALLTDVMKYYIGKQLKDMEDKENRNHDDDDVKRQKVLIQANVKIHQRMLRYFLETLLPADEKIVKH